MSEQHGDIVQRLLDHQRELRDVVQPSGATKRRIRLQGLIDYSLLEQADSAANAVLDLTAVESSGQAATDRLGELRARLNAMQRELNGARRRAYDAVLSLDDRLAEIESGITDVASRLRELE